MLNSHLVEAGDHGRLPFRPDCPVCCAERAGGTLPAGSSVSPRTTAGLVAGLVAAGTLLPPALASAAKPIPDEEGGNYTQRPQPGATARPGDERAAEDATAVSTDPPPAPPPGFGDDDEPGSGDGPEGHVHVGDQDQPPPPVQPPAGEDAGLPGAGAPPPPAPAALPGPAVPPETAPPAPIPPAEVPAPAPAADQGPAVPEEAPGKAAPRQRSSGKAVDLPRSVPGANSFRQQGYVAPAAAATASAGPASTATNANQAAPESASGAAAGQRSRSDAGRPPGGDFHVVRPGESLWSIASELLGPGASSAAIASEVDRLWRLNADRLRTGTPDLILPGQKLRLR